MLERLKVKSVYLLKTDSSNNTPYCIGQWGCEVDLRFIQRLTGWQGLHKTLLPHIFYGYLPAWGFPNSIRKNHHTPIFSLETPNNRGCRNVVPAAK